MIFRQIFDDEEMIFSCSIVTALSKEVSVKTIIDYQQFFRVVRKVQYKIKGLIVKSSH